MKSRRHFLQLLGLSAATAPAALLGNDTTNPSNTDTKTYLIRRWQGQTLPHHYEFPTYESMQHTFFTSKQLKSTSTITVAIVKQPLQLYFYRPNTEQLALGWGNTAYLPIDQYLLYSDIQTKKDTYNNYIYGLANTALKNTTDKIQTASFAMRTAYLKMADNNANLFTNPEFKQMHEAMKKLYHKDDLADQVTQEIVSRLFA